jgi:type VI protein secretion system component Hcp
MSERVRKLQPAAAVVTLALAAVALAVAVHQPAQAAPVPNAQANCPPPVDPRPVPVNTEAFARIDGIPGDATRAQVVGQIVLTAVRSGLFAGGGSDLCGSTGQGPAAFDPIVVEKRVDRASVVLLARAAAGAHIANARISFFTVGGTSRLFLTYDLADVTVQYVRQVQRSDSLTEEVALGFRRITWAFTPTNPDGTPGGTIQACWDRARNAAC